MAIKFTPTELPEVILVEPELLPDDRGYFYELYHREKYREGGIAVEFVQDNFSFSHWSTLRGLHYQLEKPQAKLVSALQGEIWDVAVDIRPDSPNFKKWVGVKLSGESKRQLFIPAGFAHGFCILSETASVLYKCSELYHPAGDRSLLWSDADLGIDWPIQDPLLSKKDAEASTLKGVAGLGVLPAFR